MRTEKDICPCVYI